MPDSLSAKSNLLNTIFPWIYGIFLISDIIILSNPDWAPYREYSKPMILGSLILYFLIRRYPIQNGREWLFLGGLIFSFLGDGFLNYEGYFIQGLGCFFIAHVFYIMTFLHKKGLTRALSLKHLLILGGFATVIFISIANHLGALKPYVTLYMIIIILMVVSLLTRKAYTPRTTYLIGLAGGIFFLISDSLLALNKFGHPFIGANQMIMITYGIAQFLLLRTMLGVKKA